MGRGVDYRVTRSSADLAGTPGATWKCLETPNKSTLLIARNYTLFSGYGKLGKARGAAGTTVAASFSVRNDVVRCKDFFAEKKRSRGNDGPNESSRE